MQIPLRSCEVNSKYVRSISQAFTKAASANPLSPYLFAMSLFCLFTYFFKRFLL